MPAYNVAKVAGPTIGDKIVEKLYLKTTKFVLRRDLRPSRKAELGRYLGTMDWRVLFTGLQSCEELLGVFQKVLSTVMLLFGNM